MALAETAELAVKLTLDDRLSPGIKKLNSGFNSLKSGAAAAGKGIAIGLGVAATAGIVVATNALKEGVAALKRDQVVAAQTAAVLKSTGGAAGVTADQVKALADSLSTLNGVQDDVVQGAENVILRFTHIGKDVFPQVTQAALDIAAATGTDASTAALKLGRALDDPLKSLGALTRLGIVFTDQEKAQIVTLEKHNRLREAQAIVLAKVQQKFEGVAQAQADADPSRRLNVAVEKLQKAFATGLLPVIEKIQVRLTEFLSKKSTIDTITRLGDAISGLFTDQNLDTVATGLETAAKAVSLAISAFSSLPPEIKALAIGAFAINKVTGGAVGGAASAFGKLLGAGLNKIFANNVTVIGKTVGGPGAGGPAGTGNNPGGIGEFLGGAGVAAIGAAILEGVRQAAGAAVQAVNPNASQSGFNTITGGGNGQGPLGLLNNLTNLPKLLDAVQHGNILEGGLLDQVVNQQQATTGATRDMDKNLGSNVAAATRSLGAHFIKEVSALNAASNKISGHISKEESHLSNLQARLANARENHESARAARLRDRITAVKGDIDRSNAKLEAIRRKKTTLTNNISIPVTTNVSVRDFRVSTDNKTRYSRTYAIAQ